MRGDEPSRAKGGEPTTWAQASFRATHHLAVRPEPHEHTWTVRAYRPSEPWRDARELQLALKATLALVDGRDLNVTLGDKGASMEGLCRWALKRLLPAGVIGVEVWREAEGLGASRWS